MHQAAITESYRAGVLHKSLVLALVGLTSSLVNLGPGTRELGVRYIDEAESILLREMETPTLSKLQALILIIKYRENTRRFASVFMLTAMAMRSAIALRLNYEHPSQPCLTREGCRRVLWSLFMIDTHLAGGYQDFTLCPADIIHVQLPCHEINYKLNLPSQAPNLSSSTTAEELSPLAHVIHVRWLRHRVLAFTKKTAVLKLNRPLNIEVRAFQQELNTYIASLPTNLHFSAHNARLHSYSDTFSAFATIHIVWHTTHCILYRLTLHGMKEALPSHVIDDLDPSFVYDCRAQCLEKSRTMAEVIRVVTLSGVDITLMDLDMAVNAYQCARMLFHLHRSMPDAIGASDLHACVGYCEAFVNSLLPDCETLQYIVSPHSNYSLW
jgi:Fungal specific transcription factor domain